MTLEVPANALMMLVGAAASGKSTWAAAHFATTEVVSSDRCRELVSDDEADQRANAGAFAVFYEILRQRTALGRLSVADSTALQEFARRRIREIGHRRRVPVHAVVFCTPLPALLERNAGRSRRVSEEVLRHHAGLVEALLEEAVLEREGYQAVHYLREPVPVVRTAPRSTFQPVPPAPAPTEPHR